MPAPGKTMKKLNVSRKDDSGAVNESSSLLPQETNKKAKCKGVPVTIKKLACKIADALPLEKRRRQQRDRAQAPPGKDWKALLDANMFLEACTHAHEQDKTNPACADSFYEDIARHMWKVLGDFFSGTLHTHEPLRQVAESVKWEKNLQQEFLEKSFDADGGVQWTPKGWEAQLESCLKTAINLLIPSFSSRNRTLSEHLSHIEIILDSKFWKNAPILQEVGLFIIYVKCFDRCIHEHLEALLAGCHDYGECALLYIWVTKDFKRKLMEHSSVHEKVLGALDHSLHSRWSLKAEEKFLECVMKYAGEFPPAP
ncbi:uncharacterized protein [Ambystoma mexicanum]|uniref:uncharacterized protein n=1 Tax=Ambystoma mexicanum TaxID=8296 RepID=UPI0037E72613